MAVQKSRVSRSRRGMRRAHDGLTPPTLAVDRLTGEKHRRHHMSARARGETYRTYLGRVIHSAKAKTEETNSHSHPDHDESITE